MKILSALTLLILLAVMTPGNVAGQMSVVNGASFHPQQPLAPGSFGTIFGEGLCGSTATGSWIAPGQLPTELGGCMVAVDGVPAMLHHVSPGQVNFIMPPTLMPGTGDVVVNDNGAMTAGQVGIAPAAPGMFALGGTGMGLGAMLHGTLWRTGPFSTMTLGQPTHLSLFVTGLDLSQKPVVMVGGVEVEVTFFGPAPGHVGLHQINVVLPESMAGIGHVPVTVTSGHVVSNVTFMEILPTDSMMRGVPGWGPGMHVAENAPRGRSVSDLAWNTAGGNLVVADQTADALRLIDPGSGETQSTIPLPAGAVAQSLAVNRSGTAAVALRNLSSIALIDLSGEAPPRVIATGSLPARLAFAGEDRLVVSNASSGSATVIDVANGTLLAEFSTGFGPHGVAANATTAVVANMQEGSATVVNMADLARSTIELPPGIRPMEVALSADSAHAVLTAPMSGGAYVLDVKTGALALVDLGFWNAMGPGAVVIKDSTAYIASMMTASVAALDLNSRTVTDRIEVSPGPRALALEADGNRLFVLSNSTGAVDVVDLASHSVVSRLNAAATASPGEWRFPSVTSILPASGAADSGPIEFTVTGENLESVTQIEFRTMGPGGGMGGLGMGPGGMGPGMGPGGGGDSAVTASGVSASSDGRQLSATLTIAAGATPGPRRMTLVTERGLVGVPGFAAVFTVTQ